MSNDKTIAVIGAGIAGLTAAYYLARAGYNVAVYDSEHYAGMRCSYANGGQLSVSNSETWHSWSNVVKGIKWLTKADAPLLIRPGFDFDRIAWITRFLLETYRGTRVENTAKTIALGLESRSLYAQIAEEEGLDYCYSKSGILHIYKDPQYFYAAKNAKNLYESNGCQWDVLDQKGVARIEPTLTGATNIVGGVWTEDDAVGDIHQFCTGLERVLRTKYRVKFWYGLPVDPDKLREIASLYGKVVISAGAESKRLAAYLGDKCTIYPVKGYSVTINHEGSGDLLPKVSLLDDQAKIVSSTLGGRLRVAGTAELCGYNYDIRRSRIEPLLRWVRINFPEVNTHNYTSWACLRPMTSNMMPMVGASRVPGFYYHTGHGHLGWTTSPATARRLVEVVEGAKN